MSRTYREREGKVPRWLGYDNSWEGYRMVKTRKEGKALKREIAVYHSDSYDSRITPSPWFRQTQHGKHRMNAKAELMKYYKNRDHEVQIRSNPCWPRWD